MRRILVEMMMHSVNNFKLTPASGATALGSVKHCRISQFSLTYYRVTLLFILLLGVAFSVAGKDAQPSAADPVLEERVLSLAKELRCLVCQNETLADSRADLAVDLRNQIREQMKAGKSDKEIIGFLTERYGKFILYRPPMDPTTYLLWFGPFILLLGGLLLLFRYVKQRRELIIDKPLSADERNRAESLLKSQGKEIA
jgi:cytochrome c-type biogenesis protein CcmH